MRSVISLQIHSKPVVLRPIAFYNPWTSLSDVADCRVICVQDGSTRLRELNTFVRDGCEADHVCP
jgi:hypothetical protein